MNAAVVSRRPEGERGVALLIALLSLMVLTLLGLTLAATTSTELQIASNYRWSQQALYNAEAGVEAGKVILQGVPTSWASILPPARGVNWKWDDQSSWLPDSNRRPSATSMAAPGARHWENQQCDDRGMREGYGVVLGGAAVGQDMQYIPSIFGQNLNGAFTLWVRRPVNRRTDGQFVDETRDDILVLTSEGIAPTITGDANAALRVFEVTLMREDPGGPELMGKPCNNYHGQNGGGITGDNYGNCADLGANANALIEMGCRAGGTSSPTEKTANR